MLARPPILRAIMMMCLAALCFTLNDTMTKFLLVDYHVTVIILLRSLMAMPLLMVLGLMLGGGPVRWSRRVWFHALRGAINLLGAYLYIKGLTYLTVAEASVIVFASPCMVTAGSVLFFKETVIWQKWAAVLVSFVGVIIAIQPGAGTFQPASLFILGAAFLYAINSLTSRWIPEQDSLWTVSFLGAAASALFMAPFTIGHWSHVDPLDIIWFAGAALCSSLGIGLGTLAYRSAPAADLAPFSYSGLIWSIIVTWIVWSAAPGLATLLGALIIAASSAFHFMARRQTAVVSE
ncbi:DMT family transporter [Cypionkella sp.]|uniref:DMT family transporter n=1 Tax=Cypionkella sp. TaxID=2811411 RepID=UPI002604D516|nr:DMT family transporter [Cypionkella sp.]MDB5664181.1 hypothetical protein [Cypionkella sp.]